ncbi:hypothetical protein HPB51_011545 [Rhipicephalus microplus]|uniref:Uncharacterized protein n=1 Tax=Rhipicephalus microplus TaxID=6941 RepID=A0A9J6DML2_RHIMP|nr:hypothetical protein HPB51_011545 [Rhipicephalus microplus]
MADPMTQLVGKINDMEPLDDCSSDWTSYDQRLTSFLHFNKVLEAHKVRAFVSLEGTVLYAVKVHKPRGLAVWYRHQDQLLLGAADIVNGEEIKDTFL